MHIPDLRSLVHSALKIDPVEANSKSMHSNSTAFEQCKIPGLFLRSKFVPTHQCKRISKSFASAKKKKKPTLIIFMALGLLLILMLQ